MQGHCCLFLGCVHDIFQVSACAPKTQENLKHDSLLTKRSCMIWSAQHIISSFSSFWPFIKKGRLKVKTRLCLINTENVFIKVKKRKQAAFYLGSFFLMWLATPEDNIVKPKETVNNFLTRRLWTQQLNRVQLNPPLFSHVFFSSCCLWSAVWWMSGPSDAPDSADQPSHFADLRTNCANTFATQVTD